MYRPEPMGLGEVSVLHLLAPARFGGLERVVQCLSRGQSEAGYRVHVAAVGSGEDDVGPFLSWFRTRDIPTTPLGVPDRRYLRERRLVRELCVDVDPDVVHTHGYRADVVDSPVARRLGVPTVTTVHGFTGRGVRNRVYEALQRRAFRRFDAVVAVAGPQVPILRASRVPAARIHLIRNAMDEPEGLESPGRARERLGVDAGVFHVGWVGRLSSEKGPDVLLEAMAGLPHRDFVASFVGDGPMGESLRRRAEHARLSDRLRWHGDVPNAASLLTAFDVVVLSSRTEGTPMVLLEAMHAEVPVVATRVGGIPDVASPEEALLVDPEDAEGLALALEEVRLHPEHARERARVARRRVKTDFHPRAWVEHYDRVYRGLLDTPPS